MYERDGLDISTKQGAFSLCFDSHLLYHDIKILCGIVGVGMIIVKGWEVKKFLF
jgi:hypothetical protein